MSFSLALLTNISNASFPDKLKLAEVILFSKQLIQAAQLVYFFIFEVLFEQKNYNQINEYIELFPSKLLTQS